MGEGGGWGRGEGVWSEKRIRDGGGEGKEKQKRERGRDSIGAISQLRGIVKKERRDGRERKGKGRGGQEPQSTSLLSVDSHELQEGPRER